MTTKSSHKGFTLIEVIIVVAIIGILSAVAIPAIMHTLPRYRLRAEARELVINFKKAKIEAVKHNRRCSNPFHGCCRHPQWLISDVCQYGWGYLRSSYF